MKSVSFLFPVRILLVLFISHYGTSALASHGMGGEITWRCNGSNEYIFQMKFYRDCNGIPGPPYITMNTTVPGIPTIPMSLVSQTDISPDGLLASGVQPCSTCVQGNASNPVFGLVEEFIYESAPISLSGVPPATGWEFSWGECCRSAALTNIPSAGTVGFLYKATMYPYQNQNATQCFDSSPYFAERPTAIICTGNPYTYHHLSFDDELDSLSYAFDTLYNEFGTAMVFAPGYTVNNPLADPVTLNPQTGEMSFTPTQGGYFATVTKVSAYKCGILVAEIRREINVAISSNCPNILDGNGVQVPNVPPVIVPPFQDSTGAFVNYADTVIAGDTVNFDLILTDFQFFQNFSNQNIFLNAYGIQYGDSCLSDSTGCLIPPCATLDAGSPNTFPLAGITVFNWRTTPAHLNYSFSCVQFSNTYYFLNKVTDNYCPANATDAKVIAITVLPAIPQPPVVDNSGTLECPWGSGYVYQWFFNRFAIPGATSSTYTPVQSGTYQVLAVEPGGQGNYSQPYYFSPVGMNDYHQVFELSARPNPSATGNFELLVQCLDAGAVQMSVTSVSGKEIMKATKQLAAGENRFMLNLSEFASGMYFLELKSNTGAVSSLKLVNHPVGK